MCVFGKVSVGDLGGYWVGIACMYWVRFCCVFYDVHWMYVFGNVSLSVLWRVFGEYWMCLPGMVSLGVLWQV